MVLPDKLLRVGLAMGMHLPANGHGVVQRDVALSGVDHAAAAAANNDLVRFHSTLKIARGIVEDQQQSEMVEVPTEGLVSILDRIRTLEDEVLALMKGNKQTLPAGDESTATAAASVAAAGADVGGASAGAVPSQAAGGASPDESAGPSSSAETTTPVQPSSGAIFREQHAQSDSQDDCAPEQLLYSLGGGSLQKRGSSVSGHPLFRRNANCTLENVSDSQGKSSIASASPDDTTVASVPTESQETASAEAKPENEEAVPAATVPTETTGENSDDGPSPTGVSIDGKTVPVETVQPSQLASEAEDVPSAAAPEGDTADSTNPIFGPMTKEFGRPPYERGSTATMSYPEATPSLSTGSVLKEEEEAELATAAASSEPTTTTTITSTRTTTTTIHLALAPSSNWVKGKYANAKSNSNADLPATATAEASSASVATAPSSEATEASTDDSASGQDESELTENPETTDGAMKMESTSTSPEEASVTPDAEIPGLQSTESAPASKEPLDVEQESFFKNNTATQLPPVSEEISVPSTLLEDSTAFSTRPAVTSIPVSKKANYMFNAFVNGSVFDTRSSGFKTVSTMRVEVPDTEAQQ